MGQYAGRGGLKQRLGLIVAGRELDRAGCSSVLGIEKQEYLPDNGVLNLVVDSSPIEPLSSISIVSTSNTQIIPSG